MAAFPLTTSCGSLKTTNYFGSQHLLTFELHPALPSSSSRDGPSSNTGESVSSECYRRCNGKGVHP